VLLSYSRNGNSYTVSLENKVQHLLALLDGSENGALIAGHCPDILRPETSTNLRSCTARSNRALQDLAFLNWKSSALPDERFIFSGPVKFTIPVPSLIAEFSAAPAESVEMSVDRVLVVIEEFSQQVELKTRLVDFFMNFVNAYYRFVDPSWLLFYQLFPQNEPSFQLLYSAVFAVSAYCLNESGNLDRALLAYAEMLVIPCSKSKPSLPVLMAISILAWFKQTLVQRSDGFAYQCLLLFFDCWVVTLADYPRYGPGALYVS
jgi:hypothetical protein